MQYDSSSTRDTSIRYQEKKATGEEKQHKKQGKKEFFLSRMKNGDLVKGTKTLFLKHGSCDLASGSLTKLNSDLREREAVDKDQKQPAGIEENAFGI